MITVHFGNFEIAQFLLQDPRVNPSDDALVDALYEVSYAPFKETCTSGNYLKILDLLLQDPRIDPTFDDNVVIKKAVNSGNFEIVERLLQDPRVFPRI